MTRKLTQMIITTVENGYIVRAGYEGLQDEHIAKTIDEMAALVKLLHSDNKADLAAVAHELPDFEGTS